MEELNNQNQPEENKANPEPIIDSGFQKMLKITSNIEAARREMRKYVIGQDEMIDLMMIGVLSGGHILLEGVPGIAKTLTAKALARTLSVHFARIQFTPDIVLIDEINRAPAKTQSALFEVMEERQITYDGITYEMEYPFLVLATQNPIEQEGTYRLPEAQLDRFLFRVKLTYPKPAEERDILSRYKDEIKSPDLKDIAPIFNPTNLKEFQELIKQVKVEDQLIKYIAEIVTNTREHGRLYLGASPRASLALLKSSKALAAMRGRDFIIPDDVQFLAYHVLNHRIILSPEAEMEGVTTEDVIKEIIQKIEVPR
jgi:MoxR-like ATPase